MHTTSVWKRPAKNTSGSQIPFTRSSESLSQQLHPLKAEKLGELNAIDYQIKLCRKEVFFEEEQQELKTRIQNYANFHTERKNRIAQAQLIIKELTMTWEEEQQKQLKEKT